MRRCLGGWECVSQSCRKNMFLHRSVPGAISSLEACPGGTLINAVQESASINNTLLSYKARAVDMFIQCPVLRITGVATDGLLPFPALGGKARDSALPVSKSVDIATVHRRGFISPGRRMGTSWVSM